MELRHIGIILVILGTICLAFSVKTTSFFKVSSRTEEDKRYIKDIVNRAQDGTWVAPTMTWIDRRLF